MIQRVQSIFLFLVGVLMLLTLFFPIWEKTNAANQESASLTVLSLSHQKGSQTIVKRNTVYLSVVAFVVASVAFGSLFSFKSRLKQLKLGMVNAILMTVFLFTTVYLLFQGERFFDVAVKGSFKLSFYFIIAALFCNLLANRFIRMDEKLVRDSDRLR